MAARCEAAGRPENEDNFQLSSNLSKENWGFNTDKEIALSKNGALLVVCDGMGGMNAGKEASALAVETVIQHFSNDDLNAVVSSPSAIKKYIEKIIIAADSAIKAESFADDEKSGMGSTIVLAWLVGDKVYVGWCGDSRAYRFNPAYGLEQLSHDHSYVQELVDAGKLSWELAFDHPNNNIITRSLGDPSRTAKPDVEAYPLQNGDVILLCSDGLSGVLRNNAIEEVIADNSDTMATCRDALWDAAQHAGWHDNVTIGLCQVLSGGKKAEAKPSGKKYPLNKLSGKTQGLIITLIALVVVLLGAVGWLMKGKCIIDRHLTETQYQLDSISALYGNLNTQNIKQWQQNGSLTYKQLLERLKKNQILYNKYDSIYNAISANIQDCQEEEVEIKKDKDIESAPKEKSKSAAKNPPASNGGVQILKDQTLNNHDEDIYYILVSDTTACLNKILDKFVGEAGVQIQYGSYTQLAQTVKEDNQGKLKSTDKVCWRVIAENTKLKIRIKKEQAVKANATILTLRDDEENGSVKN
jgi:serine/threonine protein phosphatase PrpC